ncbi:MAG: peptidylprolyl isomerase [Magnetococcales bacterium]|nr:peptidylprolyl isomerase [Magnetococcales bacterium]
MQRFRGFSITVTFSLLSLLLGLGIFSPLHAGQLDRIAAVVEGDIITASEVDRVADPVIRRLTQGKEAYDAGQIRRRALEELIQRRLREHKLQEMKIQVTDKDVDQAVVQVAKNNKLSMEAFLKALQQQGISQEDFREDLRQEIIQSHLINQMIRPLVAVSEDEVKDLQQTVRGGGGAEQIHLGHILLATNEGMPASRLAQLKQQAEEIARRLRGGESLASLASQYSDEATGLKGGDMGWFKRGEMIPELEKVVFALASGAVAGPLQTAQGWHIFQVLERKSGGEASRAGKEELRVRHILLRLPGTASSEEEDQVREKAIGIRKAWEKGEDFKNLARTYSQDTTASDGGDVGWISRGLMVPEFEDAAFALNKGMVSAPVRTRFGWHLILLEERRRIAADGADASRTELENRLRESKTQDLFRQWQRDQRLRAFVEIR